ncbi:hypothetical protein LXM25_08630 [Dyadobacter sp. LJ53]|uniref:hypothetical protein n=1 Tax=Dyadobacter chenwenxiniae TaxID=2906456 RepID=UPI001F3EDE54|nr:hypothetical protein [Dyadobacter chenwenxiniae]MCF0050118.1 hypothetical protein [Dyadobacter chenwenxiniae]
MTRTFILLLAGMLWLNYQVLGQEKPPEKAKQTSKEFKDYKWDASLDMYYIFYGYSTVMIRYAPKLKGAYRLSIGHHTAGFDNDLKYVDSLDDPLNDPALRVSSRNYKVVAKVGYEFRKNAGKHQLIYGLDVNIAYDDLKQQNPIYHPERRFAGGLYPFVGLKYRILNRLSISAETTISIHYTKSQSFNEDGSLTYARRYFGSDFNPLSALNVSYHF